MNDLMKQLAAAEYNKQLADEMGMTDSVTYFNGRVDGLSTAISALTNDYPTVLFGICGTVYVLHGDDTYTFDSLEL